MTNHPNRKTSTYTIPGKMSNTGSIHDIESDTGDRVIQFGAGCKYAVVLASYYGGKGYTTHRSDLDTIAASKAKSEYSHAIIDTDGNEYIINPGYYADSLARR